jgi:hypothetical protein
LAEPRRRGVDRFELDEGELDDEGKRREARLPAERNMFERTRPTAICQTLRTTSWRSTRRPGLALGSQEVRRGRIKGRPAAGCETGGFLGWQRCQLWGYTPSANKELVTDQKQDRSNLARMRCRKPVQAGRREGRLPSPVAQRRTRVQRADRRPSPVCEREGSRESIRTNPCGCEDGEAEFAELSRRSVGAGARRRQVDGGGGACSVSASGRPSAGGSPRQGRREVAAVVSSVEAQRPASDRARQFSKQHWRSSEEPAGERFAMMQSLVDTVCGHLTGARGPPRACRCQPTRRHRHPLPAQSKTAASSTRRCCCRCR